MHFHVSLVLAAGPMHGYAIAKELEREHGKPILPGNLYRSLKQMRSKDLIRETAPDVDDDDERRRYFELTELGQAAAAAETRRMEQLVDAAHRARLATPEKESAS
jgi:DNA-binding PadR family transcriptional regulator